MSTTIDPWSVRQDEAEEDGQGPLAQHGSQDVLTPANQSESVRRSDNARVAESLRRIADLVGVRDVLSLLLPVCALPWNLVVLPKEDVRDAYRTGALEVVSNLLRGRSRKSEHNEEDDGLQRVARALGLSLNVELRRATRWHEQQFDRLHSLLTGGQTLRVVLGQEGPLPSDTAAALDEVLTRIRRGLLAGTRRRAVRAGEEAGVLMVALQEVKGRSRGIYPAREAWRTDPVRDGAPGQEISQSADVRVVGVEVGGELVGPGDVAIDPTTKHGRRRRGAKLEGA